MITSNTTTLFAKRHEKTSLHHDLYSFVCSLIAIRKRLLKTERSLKNKMRMAKTVENIDRLLIANRYDNDRLMASFFIRHSEELEEIIPGAGSKLHEKYQERFKSLLHKANQHYVRSKAINQLVVS